MTAPLREGSRGPEVVELQWLLRATGHDPGPLDGIFGPRTALAVRDEETTRIGWPIELAEMDPEHIAALRAIPRVAVEMPRLHTPTTIEALRSALEAGYDRALPDRDAFVFAHIGKSVRGAAVRVALAQLAEEHGADYSAIWSNNLGNRQVGAEDRDAHGSPTVPHFYMSPLEGSGSGAKKICSPHYAFPPGPTGLEEGAAAYWRFLRGHCAPALAAFEAGDPARAAHELKIGAWHFSGSEADYARAMVDRFRTIP